MDWMSQYHGLDSFFFILEHPARFMSLQKGESLVLSASLGD